MTFGSLFSGIGGLDLGLERAGMKCAWQVEIDPYCQRVLAKHWPDVPKHLDVREVGGHNLGPVDLICGGFPCQDISFAGGGAGMDGARSGLWTEFARLIRELRPRLVLVENVAALTVRGLGRVLGDLAALGFDAEWSCVSACSMGAPHMRQRLFIVADANGFNGRAGVRHSAERPDWALQEVHRLASARAGWNPRLANPSELYGGTDGVPHRMDRSRAIGNAVVPQVAEFIGRRIMEAAC